MSKAGLLNSWKEIANYLGRGVRTVQRWEGMGLPVRRLGKGLRAPVIAYRADIDRWLQQAHQHRFEQEAQVNQILFRGDLRQTISESRALRAQMRTLRANQQAALENLQHSIITLGRLGMVTVSNHRFATASGFAGLSRKENPSDLQAISL